MRALVIGGTGFIGSHIADALLSKGWEVRVTVRRSLDLKFQNPKYDPKIEYVYGNVLDTDSLRNCFSGIDFVCTCFGLLGNWGVPERSYWDMNVEGLRNVLAAMPGEGTCRLIHLSSAGVLGPLADHVIADESFHFAPSNIYEKTKCVGEKEVHKFASARRIPFTILRPEFVYGPGDMHVLGLFRAIKRGRFVLIGTGHGVLHPTYIDDLTQGFLLCTENDRALGGTYMVTGREIVTVKNLGTAIADELGVKLPPFRIPEFFAKAAASLFESFATIANTKDPILTHARVKFFTENRAFTSARAQRELGFSPKVDLREGIKRTIRWYQEKGHL
jgi:nucleoside-diphosphate-sugar epimerase